MIPILLASAIVILILALIVSIVTMAGIIRRHRALLDRFHADYQARMLGGRERTKA